MEDPRSDNLDYSEMTPDQLLKELETVNQLPDDPPASADPPPPPPGPEKVADPTDADLDQIEEAMLAELAAERAAVEAANTPAPGAPKRTAGRPPRKKKLLADIEQFRGACPDLLPAHWKLKKTKVADLEILLARCVSQASGHPLRPNTAASDPPGAERNVVAGAPALDPRLNAPGLNGKTVAGTLTDLNILAMEMVEFGTSVASPYTDGFVVSGAAVELRTREQELEDIIRNVYADNKAICDKFVSPTLAWASLMTAVALKNVKKVDPISGEVLSAQEYVARQKAAAAADQTAH